MTTAGTLILVATPIGNLGDFSPRAAEVLTAADVIACEDTRVTRKLLRLTGTVTSARMVPYHDHNGAEMRPWIIEQLAKGRRVALVSDAGTPLISDPGYKLVAGCHDHGFTVTAVPGPSAPLAALTVSGLPSDKFVFAGFLPPTRKACDAAIRDIRDLPMTIIWFETPRRLLKSLTLMADILGPRLAVVARELTKIHEEVIRAPLPDLIAQIEQRESLKGEIVILVEGRQNDDTVFDEVDVTMMLQEELRRQSLRDAVKAIVGRTGLPKRTIYQLALKMSNATPPD
ncbi:MAG: 16S rRNA (cytidine(1402)-2'-O)-methyltransferase [Candidatus Puniceispirillaceae bacterium]